MRRFVLGLFAAIGIVSVLVVIGTSVAVWWLFASRPGLPSSMVLTIDFGRGLAEGSSQSPFSDLLFGKKQSLRDFLDALERAGNDSRVKGLYARFGGDNITVAKAQEVRDAIRDFRSKGKFAIAFADSFGEFGGGTRPYYLATGFDEIWLQPMGEVGLVGLRSEVPFLRGTLDKLGVLPRFEHREEYKTAANSLTETQMTAPQREMTEDLLGSILGQVVRGIADARKLSPDQVASLIERGPFFADDAKAAHLVDRIGYRDEAVARTHERAGSGAELMSMSRYLRGAGRPHDSGTKIALIYGTGLITASDSGGGSLAGDEEMSARKLTRAFRQAVRDDKVRAILFRIDSPGGSAVASETIWREVVSARERGKPVIVSMGEVAGSGGYYVAAPADKIVAEPATLTGSIGVLAGKLVVSGFLQKLGITTDAVETGANAGIFSAVRDFSPEALQRLNSMLDVTYRGFKQHVAAGRHLSEDQVEAVAKGRVWTGEEAKAKGLVDELGGYTAALRLAKQAAKIPEEQDFNLTVFPRGKGTLERIYDRLANRDSDNESDQRNTMQRAMTSLDALVARIDALIGERGVLRMPDIGEMR